MGRARGFSLLEMLVVLFVIVLITSLVSLNVGSGSEDQRLRQQLETLMAIAGYALDEAQFSGTDFGVLFVAGNDAQGEPAVTAYWRQRLAEGWREPQRSQDVFVSIGFLPGAEFDLTLEDIIVLPAEAAAADPRNGRAPQWLLSASGETQAGELRLRPASAEDDEWRMRWDALARFELIEPGGLDAQDGFAARR